VPNASSVKSSASYEGMAQGLTRSSSSYGIAAQANPTLAERFQRSLNGGFLRYPDPYPPAR